MRTSLYPLLATLLVAGSLAAARCAATTYPRLSESVDPELQSGLEATVHALGLDTAAREKRLGVVVADITVPARPRVAHVNGDRMFYAASLPKIAILLGAFVEAESGELALDEDARGALTRMIRNSSNRDATAMLERVGRERLIEILRSPRYGLYDPASNGGLWVGKPYGKSPAYRRDPLHNLSHGATAMQTARFYYLLDTGRLVAPDLTRQMKGMLSRPGIRHKFVKGLGRHPGLTLYRKSGTWRTWHADSVLVVAGKRRYIAVALAKDAQGGKWLTRLIEPVHTMVLKGPAANPLQIAHLTESVSERRFSPR